jgi:uncharacterized protein YggU (UPF0235/DUF167 family)
MLLQVKVKPNARTSALMPAGDGTWVAHLRSPPVDGRANEELIALVAGHFRVSRAAVSIRGGASGRTKYLSVPDPAAPPTPKE